MIDGTVDGGGHAIAILKRIAPMGMFLGVDLDRQMVDSFKGRVAAISSAEGGSACGGKSRFPRLPSRTKHGGQVISKPILIEGDYADLPEILKGKKLPKADGLLLDLGFSSDQLESSGRGFSFLRDEPLLMTYSKNAKPVHEILRTIKEKDLREVIFRFGEERWAGKVARAIKEAGRKNPIRTSGELKKVIQGVLPKNYERGRIHPATRTFQALRIYANDELENLEKVLRNLLLILKPGGRAVIISFHSLEDRVVKGEFRRLESQRALKILTKKPITASLAEVKMNPRSRSAKLRAAIIT